MKLEDKFLNRTKFTKLIEESVIKNKLSYMDSILDICDKNDIDPVDVKKFISPIIKTKVEAEAMALNFLPKENTLDSSLFE